MVDGGLDDDAGFVSGSSRKCRESGSEYANWEKWTQVLQGGLPCLLARPARSPTRRLPRSENRVRVFRRQWEYRMSPVFPQLIASAQSYSHCAFRACAAVLLAASAGIGSVCSEAVFRSPVLVMARELVACRHDGLRDGVPVVLHGTTTNRLRNSQFGFPTAGHKFSPLGFRLLILGSAVVFVAFMLALAAMTIRIEERHGTMMGFLFMALAATASLIAGFAIRV